MVVADNASSDDSTSSGSSNGSGNGSSNGSGGDSMLDLKTASTIATSIVHAKLNYCNSLFLNIDVTQINRLQAIQNALACAVTKTPRHHHITPVLKKLHWLKIPERIEYKVISLTYNTLQSPQPSSLRKLFTIQPPR